MKYLGEFKVVSQEVVSHVGISNLDVGVNSLKNHFIKLDQKGKIEYVISKECDHAGGKLIQKGNKAVCPMHGWELNLNSLNYNDSHFSKNQIPFTQEENDMISFKSYNSYLKNNFKCGSKEIGFKFRWLNHAAVYIECNGISLITDPWFLGPAFMTGWWLYEPSPEDSFELLKKVDYVFISHNHPDHLHPETLDKMPKDKPIIVGNFKSKSTEKYLKALGYQNLIVLDFNAIYELEENFLLSVLKSGDFRDDAGIYLSLNGHEVLLSVDSNYLNSFVLPKNIDLLMTSFAGGASGFPVCFEDYTLKEKTRICERNRIAIKSSVLGYIKSTSPKYYMPYAGMFKEKADRDESIQTINLKNSVQDCKSWLERSKVAFLSPSKYIDYEMRNGEVREYGLNVSLLPEEDTAYYINEYKKDFIYKPNKIISYLENSGFKGNQIIQIIPTNDNFKHLEGEIVFADFQRGIFKKILPSELITDQENMRVMNIRVRKEVIACIVENMLPWEDFSIGFQLRVTRVPNTYESDFWYYFTNIYINENHFRYSSYCGACSKINQNPVFNKFNISKKKQI